MRYGLLLLALAYLPAHAVINIDVVTVANWIGQSAVTAESTIEAQGLTVTLSSVCDSAVSASEVSAQAVEAFLFVSDVGLDVARGFIGCSGRRRAGFGFGFR